MHKKATMLFYAEWLHLKVMLRDNEKLSFRIHKFLSSTSLRWYKPDQVPRVKALLFSASIGSPSEKNIKLSYINIMTQQ